MRDSNFPASRILSPDFRKTALKPRHEGKTLQRVKNNGEFQRLIELSLHNSTVLQISLISTEKPALTTGIVKEINPRTGIIVLQTLEGLRSLKAHDISDIAAFP